ncbi:hypothetical protein AMTRI_Chr07g80010 [Amborella trichopoda]
MVEKWKIWIAFFRYLSLELWGEMCSDHICMLRV